MKPPKAIAFASYGNDSVALIQWLHENGVGPVAVLYSDTGWSAGWWAERVARMESWVRSIGFRAERTASVGFADLAVSRRLFPNTGMQFCTTVLKIEPALAWMDEADPAKEAVCFVGVRREESKKRESFDEWQDSSLAHGGRPLWAPLARYDAATRDALIRAAGFEVLPHRSKECFPCIFANRADLRMVADDEAAVSRVRNLERDLGLTAAGQPKTMFRPKRYQGASGIDEVLRWAKADRGQYEPPDDSGAGPHCDGGFCGT